MKAIIIDDEPLAREILRDYISEVVGIELLQEFDSALKASAWLAENAVDLIFLDIQMPKLTGIQWLKSSTIQQKSAIIITSAYSEFVSDSYELSVFDYLLKPISFERFLRSVERLKHIKKEDSPNQSMLIKVDKSFVLVDFEQILFIQGMGDYVKIFTPTKTYVTQETMKNLTDKLPEQRFFRVHKSYIVNKGYIERIDGNVIPITKHEIPISPNEKEAFLKWLAK